jgi:hypothetical protein
MLRLIEIFNTIPFSFPVSQSAQFQPGFIAQLAVEGMQVVATVSNGLAPIGIIDDIKTRAFTANAWDETIVAPVANIVTNSNNQLVNQYDVKWELVNPNVLPQSFVSIPVPCQLIPRNGVVVFPAGTVLNYDLVGSGSPNALKTNVRYTYQQPNIIGDDSTFGSQRVTLWLNRGLFSTDCYDTAAAYPLNSNLFISPLGMLTTTQQATNYPGVAIVTGPPSVIDPSLQFLWL